MRYDRQILDFVPPASEGSFMSCDGAAVLRRTNDQRQGQGENRLLSTSEPKPSVPSTPPGDSAVTR